MDLFYNFRHWTVTAPLLAIGAALCTGPALGQTPIKFTLDGKIEGPVAPFVVAVDKGLFKAQGLDVSIDAALGTPEALARVAREAGREIATTTDVRAMLATYHH